MTLKTSKNYYSIIGQMSGTSLDGVDLALCDFFNENGKWKYSVKNTVTYEYTSEWINFLNSIENLSTREFIKYHIEYGKFLGNLINDFIRITKSAPEYISSHGHTIFHSPEEGYTFQLGLGSAIATTTGITTISDFRTSDVLLGGQGAPLVPAGDSILFGDYDLCLNIGGFANISFIENNKRIAFDICPANIILNKYASKLNYKYDDKGNLASSGELIPNLLEELNNLEFYNTPPPKSLGTEWLNKIFIPLIEKYNSYHIKNILNTLTLHIAVQINKITQKHVNKKLLITGGGAFNSYLINKIKETSACTIIIPDKETICYKEAIIFAFLGVLRLRMENNCLASVTGASADHCSGTINPGNI